MESNKIVLDYFIKHCDTYSAAKGLAGSLFYHGNAQEYSSTVDISVEQLYGNYFTIDGALVYEREFNMVKESTSSKKKPTRTTYEKVEFEHAWEAVKAFEEGKELFYDAGDELREPITSATCALSAFDYAIYRKVEKEIDWRDEVKENFNDVLSTPYMILRNDKLSDRFLDMCRTALRVMGELE